MYTILMPDKNDIRIDTKSAVPVYRQIVDQLRVLIVEARLPVGRSLPPVRTLALELGVHFNTVAEAYRTLAQEKLVEISHGRRARVVDRSAAQPSVDTNKSAASFRKRLREMIAEFQAKGFSPRQIARELRGASEGI
jgi:DNA-binding transcriptional regulator YhcF (GntR family)